MTLRATGELAALQGEGGALPDKLFHNESKLLDTNTGDRDRSIGKIDPDGPCHKLLDDIKAKDHADHLFPGREAAGAAAVQAKSGDWIWRLDLVHGGTGDEGPTRLFGILVHQSQAERSDPKEELYLTSSFTTRRQPMEEFIKNLRAKEIHLAISGGSYPAHTHQLVVMGAGIFGMTIPFDSMLGRGNGGASEFGDDAASQDGGAPDLISSDDESEELGAAGTSGG
jgi:hypothetical protein